MEDLINKIHHGDCISIMRNIPDKSIDMILCDPPYGITQNEWDVPLQPETLWEEYKRICKDNAAIVLTASQPFASYLIMSQPKMFKYDLIWKKNKSSGFLNAKKMPLRKHEHILVFYKKTPTYNPQKTTGHKSVNSFYSTPEQNGKNYGKCTLEPKKRGGQTDRYPTSVLDFPVINNDNKEKTHPTQKPVPLFEYLIKTFSNKNDIILDNCIGSGTTAIACINTERRYIGIELSKEYFDIAEKRIKNHEKNMVVN